jgi:hypothetical protein
MSYEEMVDYVNNPKNGLTQEKVINGTKIKLTYRPTEMMVLQELRQEEVSREKIKQVGKKYAPNHYFVLSYSHGGKEILNNASDRQRFSYMVNQFSFGIGNNVVLTTAERDTLPLIDFHSSRTYGIANSTDILFVFNKEQKKTKHYIFKLKEFGLRTGDIQFQQDVKKIKI